MKPDTAIRAPIDNKNVLISGFRKAEDLIKYLKANSVTGVRTRYSEKLNFKSTTTGRWVLLLRQTEHSRPALERVLSTTEEWKWYCKSEDCWLAVTSITGDVAQIVATPAGEELIRGSLVTELGLSEVKLLLTSAQSQLSLTLQQVPKDNQIHTGQCWLCRIKLITSAILAFSEDGEPVVRPLSTEIFNTNALLSGILCAVHGPPGWSLQLVPLDASE